MSRRAKISKNVRKSVEADAVAALAGADYVRDKLRALFDMGPNPVSNLAYAVKIRVKSEDRLVDKVLSRRLDGKSEYEARSATDIVGVRLISIYSEGLLELCRRLIELLGFAQTSQVKIVAGATLPDCIHEIKVYRSKNASYVYSLIYKEFMTLHFGNKEDGTPKIELVDSPDEKPYSSVHVVVDGISYYAKTPKHIPIEIQVRTIFEDAWAEMDHPLKYKDAAFQTRLRGGRAPSQEYTTLLDQAQSDLRLFKGKMDLISQEADHLRERFLTIDELFAAPRRSRAGIPFSVTYLRYRADKFFGDITPTEIRQRLTSLNNRIDKYYDETFATNRDNRNQLVEGLTAIVDEAQSIIAEYQKLAKREFDSDSVARYFLYMETALALLWRFRIANHYKDATLVQFQSDINEAIRIYCDLDNCGEFSDDPIVLFRLANAILIKGGHIDYVIELLASANDRLKKSVAIRQVDQIRVWIPRQFAFALWKKKQHFEFEIGGMHNVPLSKAYKIELLELAISSTREAMDQAEKLHEKVRRVESAKNWNNLISYSWELFDVTGINPISEAERPLYEEGLREIAAIYLGQTETLIGLDTVMKGRCLLLDHSGALETAKKVQDLLTKERNIDSTDRLSVESAMRRIMIISRRI